MQSYNNLQSMKLWLERGEVSDCGNAHYNNNKNHNKINKSKHLERGATVENDALVKCCGCEAPFHALVVFINV